MTKHVVAIERINYLNFKDFAEFVCDDEFFPGAKWVTGEDFNSTKAALEAIGFRVNIEHHENVSKLTKSLLYQTIWTSGVISPPDYYRFGGYGPVPGKIVSNGGVPLKVQSGRPYVTFSRKGFLYKSVQSGKLFFSLCQAWPLGKDS